MNSPPAAQPVRRAGAARSVGIVAAAVLPALAVLALSFRAGGYFAGATGLADVIGLGAVILVLQVARRPFAGVGTAALLAIGALTLLAVWALASAAWSDATARAVADFDRYLLYAIAVLLGAAGFRAAGRLEAGITGVAAGITIVGAAAVLTRLLPRAFHLAPNRATDRLSFPLTYWNGLGILLAAGVLMCGGLASRPEGSRIVRALAAAAVPLLAVGIYLTLARGAIAALGLGLIAFVLVARSRHLVTAAVAILPPTAIAVVVAYGQGALVSENPTSLHAATQGRHLGLVLAGCMVAALLLRLGLDPVDRRLAAWQAPRGPRGPAAWAAAAGGLVVIVVAAIALGAPHAIRTGVHRFADSSSVPNTRSRLASVGNNGRIEHWRVALHTFADHPLDGTGAGTYAAAWTRRRNSQLQVTHAHSAYLGVLSDLGLVGGVLLVVGVVALLAGLLRRALPRGSLVQAGAFAAALAWAIHAGVDWDLELPATGIWFFILGGMALAREPLAEAEGARSRGPGGILRLAGGVAVLLLAVTPALMALSQPRIGASIAAFERGDCPTAIDDALSATKVAGFRPEPYEVIGFCDVKLGNPRLGATIMAKAVARDPDWWEYRYGLGLVRGAAGLDPRADIDEARRLNPLSISARQVAAGLRRNPGPKGWRRVALDANLPL